MRCRTSGRRCRLRQTCLSQGKRHPCRHRRAARDRPSQIVSPAWLVGAQASDKNPQPCAGSALASNGEWPAPAKLKLGEKSWEPQPLPSVDKDDILHSA